MGSQALTNVQKELHSVCIFIYANDEIFTTHNCLKRKWALKKITRKDFERPMLQLILEKSRRKQSNFGPIIKAKLSHVDRKKATKTLKMVYKFLVFTKHSIEIVKVLEEDFSLADLMDYQSDLIIEDLIKIGTITSKKKTILDGQ
jgi:hypothetical protein